MTDEAIVPVAQESQRHPEHVERGTLTRFDSERCHRNLLQRDANPVCAPHWVHGKFNCGRAHRAFHLRDDSPRTPLVRKATDYA
jgi:hypothetical protein